MILGQDPYHNVNQAHGLAFSVRPPTPAPPSLRNMYKALQRDYAGTFQAPPKNGGLLTPWADRGVLLLNTCLTVRAHEANSHANRGWERLTQRAIEVVAQRRTRGVVFMAWGTPAGKRVQKVDRAKHLVLQSVHPSPLSASRGFFDCGHFRKANEWLVARYGKDGEIDWNLGPDAGKPAAAAASNNKTAGKPAPAAVKAKAKAEEDYDDDEDEDALAAAVDAAAAAEAEAEAEAKAKKAKAEADEEKAVPPPVVAVGEVKDDKKGEEKSEILEKQGENSTAAEAEAEAEAETEPEAEVDDDEAKAKAAEDELK